MSQPVAGSGRFGQGGAGECRGVLYLTRDIGGFAMPEYLYPGVYVEEYGGGTSIEGVATGTASVALIEELSAVMSPPRSAMDGRHGKRPGRHAAAAVRIFIGIGAVSRSEHAQSGRKAAARASAHWLASLPAVPTVASACKPLRRPSFFFGRLLDAATLAQEQITTARSCAAPPQPGGAGLGRVVGADCARRE